MENIKVVHKNQTLVFDRIFEINDFILQNPNHFLRPLKEDVLVGDTPYNLYLFKQQYYLIPKIRSEQTKTILLKVVNDMVSFRTDNGISMIYCFPLNFREEFIHANNIGDKFYSITVGDFAECYSCSYFPKDNIMKITNIAYSKDDVFAFKVTSFEEASKLALSFAIGMGFEEEIKDTIYTIIP